MTSPDRGLVPVRRFRGWGKWMAIGNWVCGSWVCIMSLFANSTIKPLKMIGANRPIARWLAATLAGDRVVSLVNFTIHYARLRSTLQRPHRK
jgi:hypothetical protein